MPRTSHLITGLLLLVGTRAGVAQQASEEDFQAYRSAMEGRWIGDVTWIADWPGFGKKGDKVTAYAEIRAVADGRVLVGQFYGGDGTAQWITVYDAGARQILEVGANSGGATQTCVMFRQEGQWGARCSGSLGDGTKTEGEYTVHFSDDGNTHMWRGSTTVGGEAADPLQDVWKRAGKPDA